MSHHIVDFKNVHFSYPDGTEALKGINFRITHGESVGVVGANGAGKSTMISHMNGHLMPSSGSIIIGDSLLDKTTLNEARRSVGIVFQNPDDQLFMPSVFDDVAFGPLNLGLTTEKVIERVNEALNTVGCLHLKDKPPHHLSLGQKRAVTIAGVIAMHPDILVMDEPAANLDPRSRRSLIELLIEFEHTKIIASHDLDLILDVCDRCIVIGGGRVQADGPVREILLDEELLKNNNLELPLSLQKREYKAKVKKGDNMNDLEKLKHLLGHWMEHNDAHAKTYTEWADKADALDRKDISDILRQITEDSNKLNELFKKAEEII